MTSIVIAAAVAKSFGAYQDAAVREPRTVLMAYEDYLRLAKLDRRVDLAAAISDDELAAIEEARMEPGLDHLNAELLIDKNAAD